VVKSAGLAKYSALRVSSAGLYYLSVAKKRLNDEHCVSERYQEKTQALVRCHELFLGNDECSSPISGTMRGDEMKTAKKMTKDKKKMTERENKITAPSKRNSDSRLPTSGCHNATTKSPHPGARLNAAIADIHAAVAELQASDPGLQTLETSDQWSVGSGQQTAVERQPSADGCIRNSAVCNLPSASSARVALPAPIVGNVFAIGPHAIIVNWSEVEGVGSYTLRIASEPTLTDYSKSLSIPAGSAGITVTGLGPGTTYWVGLRANAVAPDTHSNYSVAKSVTTPFVSPPGMVGDLQQWFAEQQMLFHNFSSLIPQLGTTDLTAADRRRLNGSGVRRYGFIEKTADVARDFPQIWPGLVEDAGKLNALVGEIEVLRNLLIWFRYLSRIVQDLLLIAGDDAFRLAGAYYMAARDGARRKNPEAVQVFDMLRLFWRRRRNTSNEPTEQEAKRDFHALQRGTKVGSLCLANESDKITKGKKTIIDNVVPKPREGVKVEEREEVE